MASIFRWAVVYWTLAHVVIFCGAVEDPVHIQLYLDGKDTVKMWYDPQNPATPVYNNPTQRPLVEKDELKKLYIRGTFKIEEISSFLWDNGRKDVKALVEFILKIFKPGAIVIVVFPDVRTYAGFQFQKEFEKLVQEKNEGISVGRAVINVYLGLGDQTQKKQVDKLLNDEIEKQTNLHRDYANDEKYYSIFAEYYSNKFSFRTVFTSWNPNLPPVNIHQVKIQEADSVVVKLVSVCTSDQNGLKVGGHKGEDLLTILLKLLHVDDVKTHPKQRIRVELPENCGTANERAKFTGELVDNLQRKMEDLKNVKEITVYGKEPQVHIQFYSSDMASDIEIIKKVHKQDIYINIDDFTTPKDKSLSSAKELFIHIHCHGNGRDNDYTICNKKNPHDLANILIKFAEKLKPETEEKTAIIRFHVCNAGTDYGQRYVNKFLTKFDELLQNYPITVQESWSYKYTTTQIKEHTQVKLPPEGICDHGNQLYWPYVNEKDIFGSFTVRTIKTTYGYAAFSVLPLSKYDLINNE